jgi:murein DD-endopeptidase MepM/ murein hydrolase activator NlpD
MHCGVDFGADWGEPVYAGIYGEVISTSSPSVGGNFSVTVQYGDYQILYQHLSNMAVEIGDIVGPDTMIGSIGNPAGNESLGNNHLHMEVRHDADGSGWAELIENPLGFMSVRQVQSLQISATEFLRTNPSNPGLLFSHWDTSDLFLQPNPIHRGGVVLWP